MAAVRRQPVGREFFRSKEEFRKLLPPDLGNKVVASEDPQNCEITVDGTSLSLNDWMRFTQFLSLNINVKYGAPRTKWKFSLKGTKCVYFYPYRPASEQEARNFELAGKYEDAAKEYELLGMFEKAGAVRKMNKTQYVESTQTQYVISTSFQIGSDGTVKIGCPHCGGSSSVTEKSGERKCEYCGKTYLIPKKVLDML